MEQEEIWIEMWDFPTYEISNKGNVRHAIKQKKLSFRQDGKEYRMVQVYYNKKNHTKRIGRYVWMSFNKCYCSKTINHINGDAGDDRLENLECISLADNIKQRQPFKGKNKYNLTNEDRAYIYKSIAIDKTETTWTIMKKYGIPLNYLATMLRRKSWAKYVDMV